MYIHIEPIERENEAAKFTPWGKLKQLALGRADSNANARIAKIFSIFHSRAAPTTRQ